MTSPSKEEITEAVLSCEHDYAINDARGIFRVLDGDKLVAVLTGNGSRLEIRPGHQELADVAQYLGLTVRPVDTKKALET